MKYFTLAFLLAWFAVTGWAGPVPYNSIKIYMNPSSEYGQNPSPEEIRKSAETIILLKDDTAVTFVRELNFTERMKIDRTKAIAAKPLVMVVDLFYKGQSAPFTGNHASLFCSKEIAYVDTEEERYISTDNLISLIAKSLLRK